MKTFYKKNEDIYENTVNICTVYTTKLPINYNKLIKINQNTHSFVYM
jgi:spore maturation protein CgeB